jgi:hypothetical protein
LTGKAHPTAAITRLIQEPFVSLKANIHDRAMPSMLPMVRGKQITMTADEMNISTGSRTKTKQLLQQQLEQHPKKLMQQQP